jgi:hypothetical protein
MIDGTINTYGWVFFMSNFYPNFQSILTRPVSWQNQVIFCLNIIQILETTIPTRRRSIGSKIWVTTLKLFTRLLGSHSLPFLLVIMSRPFPRLMHLNLL